MPIFFAMPGNERLAAELARLTAGELGKFECRRFPDRESYVRIHSDVANREAFVVCTLCDPDAQFLPLTFAAATISSLGATRVRLVAPYLAYMRQDRIFNPGEALTSRLFASALQASFDGIITVDPHLHRHARMSEVYDIAVAVVSAAPLFAQWIAEHVDNAFIVGPDRESARWVEWIAREAGVPWTLFSKERRGDRAVRMSMPDLRPFHGQVPVIVDDIISSGTTVRRALKGLGDQHFAPAFCLVAHALCSARTAQAIADRSAGFHTSSSVPNAHATFDLAKPIADALVTEAAKCPVETFEFTPRG